MSPQTIAPRQELLELARVCRNQAAGAANNEIAADLRRMADEYLRRAEALKRGQH